MLPFAILEALLAIAGGGGVWKAWNTPLRARAILIAIVAMVAVPVEVWGVVWALAKLVGKG